MLVYSKFIHLEGKGVVFLTRIYQRFLENVNTNKKTAQKSGFFENMAGVTGLEPMNGGIKTRCLTNLAIPQMVRKERLELSRREALEPKSSVSTNSTTSAM